MIISVVAAKYGISKMYGFYWAILYIDPLEKHTYNIH